MPKCVFKNDFDRLFVNELMDKNPDLTYLLSRYSRTSIGIRNSDSTSWYPAYVGPCPAIAICDDDGGQRIYETFSPIIAFSSLQDRNNVLKSHHDFERWFYSTEDEKGQHNNKFYCSLNNEKN